MVQIVNVIFTSFLITFASPWYDLRGWLGGKNQWSIYLSTVSTWCDLSWLTGRKEPMIYLSIDRFDLRWPFVVDWAERTNDLSIDISTWCDPPWQTGGKTSIVVQLSSTRADMTLEVDWTLETIINPTPPALHTPVVDRSYQVWTLGPPTACPCFCRVGLISQWTCLPLCTWHSESRHNARNLSTVQRNALCLY